MSKIRRVFGVLLDWALGVGRLRHERWGVDDERNATAGSTRGAQVGIKTDPLCLESRPCPTYLVQFVLATTAL